MRAFAQKESPAEYGHSGSVIDETEGFKVLDCLTCGFIHLTPLPLAGDMERIYREEYFSREKPEFITRVLEDLQWWNITYDERLDFFESTLGKGRRRLLDIGCGPGFFMQRGLQRGWQCLGIEPSRQAAEYGEGLGLDIRKGFFNGTVLKEEGCGFDALHLSEVLEHVADPLAVLAEAHALLDTGGVICVVVPNDYSPVQRVLRESQGYEPYWVSAPHHINYFSFDSMQALMRKAGFLIAEVSATFPMDFFLLMGSNYVGNDNLGRSCHEMRKNLDFMLSSPYLKEFKREMYALMARHSIGRETIIYGIKGDK